MKPSKPGIFHLPESLWEQIYAHVEANLPNEACGLIAGKTNPETLSWEAQQVFIIENILHSPLRYRMDGHGQLAVFEWIDQAETELIGIFHSHPSGPEYPSETDLKESHYPEVVSLICSRIVEKWNCRGYLLLENHYQEIQMLIE
jgi:proteasome lid subunit RPN8/RPN11